MISKCVIHRRFSTSALRFTEVVNVVQYCGGWSSPQRNRGNVLRDEGRSAVDDSFRLENYLSLVSWTLVPNKVAVVNSVFF